MYNLLYIYFAVFLKNPRKEFNAYIDAKTKAYQKKYGFEIGTGDHATWNNEADAFKHTFMQAILQFDLDSISSNILGFGHEFESKLQPQDESNMDLWNNEIGRDIGKKIKKQTMLKKKSEYPKEKIEDMIAEEIMKKMKKGDLITSPKDKRIYNVGPFSVYNISKHMKKFGITGFASNIPDGKIFTAEEIGQMSSNEFLENEDYINMQMKEMGIPNNFEAKKELNNGSMIWVDDYKRDDGTQVKGYYRRR